MGLTTWLKGVWNKLFRREIEERFDTDLLLSDTMTKYIEQFENITAGNPPWIDPKDDIESINFAGFIDDVTAGLVTLDIGIEMPDTPRGQYLQQHADYILKVINNKMSEALGNCGLMFKPNIDTIDYVPSGYFAPTDVNSNGDILGCVFQTQVTHKGFTYTRLEWHRFEGEDEYREPMYRISLYVYKAKKGGHSIGDPCSLTEVPEWANLMPEWYIGGLDRPLFAYFKNPAPNRKDRTSPLGVPIWGEALKELKDLDVAWSRKSGEVEDSKHMTFLPQSVIMFAEQHKIKLPRWVKGVEMGVNGENQIHEHVSTLLTEQRIKDINSILAMISTKCGYSQGMFVLDEKTGMMTATQVEADDQETIRTIKNIRDQLKATLNNLFYALNAMADYYTTLPAEDWKTLEDNIVYNFGNILYNWSEDRANWYSYVNQGYVPFYYYLTKFEGLSEEDAKKLVAEAEPKEPTLFGQEE